MSRYVQAYIQRPDGNEVVYTIRNSTNYRAFKSAVKSVLIEFHGLPIGVRFIACTEHSAWGGLFLSKYHLTQTPVGYSLVRSIVYRSPIPSAFKDDLCVFDVFKFLNTL